MGWKDEDVAGMNGALGTDMRMMAPCDQLRIRS